MALTPVLAKVALPLARDPAGKQVNGKDLAVGGRASYILWLVQRD